MRSATDLLAVSPRPHGQTVGYVTLVDFVVPTLAKGSPHSVAIEQRTEMG